MDFRSQALPPSQPSRRSSERFATDGLRAFERLLQRRRVFLLGNVRKLEDEALKRLLSSVKIVERVGKPSDTPEPAPPKKRPWWKFWG